MLEERYENMRRKIQLLEENLLSTQQKTNAENAGVLISSGLIAGEALMAVILAFVVLGINLSESTFSLNNFAFIEPNVYIGLLAFLGLAYLLIKIPLSTRRTASPSGVMISVPPTCNCA